MKLLQGLSALIPLSVLSSILGAPSSRAAAVGWTSTPFSPPSVPLAVRTPYLSAWLSQGAGTALNGAWPTFWNGNILGWTGYVKVDGKAYTWLGAPNVAGSTLATQTALSFTSTQSTFTLSAGPVQLVVNFLSPVNPNDLTRQSLPFSYMTVTAKSTDGGSHSVQLYSDISAEWASGDDSQIVTWSTDSVTNGLVTHSVQLQNQQRYTESSQHIQQGSAMYSIKGGSGVTYQTGQDSVVRAQFIGNGKLANTQDTNFRGVSNNWPVFALSKDLGTVGTSATAPTIFVVGHVRDPAIQYIVANGVLSDRSSYFFTSYPTAAAALNFFMGDYSNALNTANSLDSKISSDAHKVSSDYADIVSLSVRQAFGATEVTVGKNSDGSYNTNDVLVFMKEISSDGNVNTVDVIMPSWPALLYVSPSYGALLLKGLFQYQATGQYPNKWSVHDLGSSYPKAIGHNDGSDEAMPVEESGNMLIMTLSYTQAANDNSLISTYYNLLDQWTQFLISDSLIPANQLSTDDFAGTLANQTNLAIKGVIGIKAMSVIAGRLGKTSVQSNYSSIASSYVPKILGFATSPANHLELSYGSASSWGLSYNMYADKLLGTNVFSSSTYNMQTAWYQTVAQAYGVPLDTRHTYTKSDWQIWTAAIMTNTAARDLFIGSVRKYAADGKNGVPFSDWYETTTGAFTGFQARPVVGGHLALLALGL